jgi:hypothetical protein
MDARQRIISDAAQHLRSPLVRSLLRYLKSLPANLSGDDSGLRNVWQEICVQVQGEDSLYWDVYEETIRSCAIGLVSKLPPPILILLSAATLEGDNWLDLHGQSDRPAALFIDDVVDDLIEAVMQRAMADTGRAVRRYLSSFSAAD